VKIINSGRLPVENKIAIGRKDEISEFMMLGLRLVEGVSIREFYERFGENVLEVFKEQIKNLSKRGLVAVENGFYKNLPDWAWILQIKPLWSLCDLALRMEYPFIQ